jgi:hypothetical protein
VIALTGRVDVPGRDPLGRNRRDLGGKDACVKRSASLYMYVIEIERPGRGDRQRDQQALVGEMDRFWGERSARSSGRARQNWVETIYRVGCERSTTLGGGGGIDSIWCVESHWYSDILSDDITGN